MLSSDSDYDEFDYYSSHKSSMIDEQIDLFEFRYYTKSSKNTKLRLAKKSSCPLSRKTLKSQSPLLRISCAHDQKKNKAERKQFRYDHYPTEEKTFKFECDQEFQPPSTPKYSRMLRTDHLASFANFRRHFYHVSHQWIKTCFEKNSHIELKNIRLAPISESVQNDFMQQLRSRLYLPHLVYHGTALNNIESILRYGFLIPNQPHPTNSGAPIIPSLHGQQYGTGIYSSQIAVHCLPYTSTTNTLLVCAAIPKRDKAGKPIGFRYNELVLTHVSRIIPLFLIDFKYLYRSSIQLPWYISSKQIDLKVNESKEKKKSMVISRKYLCKILKFINDEQRKNNLYEIRSFLTYFDSHE
ncbi:hypothetical protein I4U23_003513 [Adineta vaga]|nr:hypothetical protein I4U23_003513 [Adineta vaga]